jgi:hypothetical protein
MFSQEFLIDAFVGGTIGRGTIEGVRTDGVRVRVDGTPEVAIECDMLRTTAAPPLVFQPGDRVMVWSGLEGGRGVVLGAIVAPPVVEVVATTNTTPDELVIQAKERLVLRVGDGSITIRGDGKILIKGKDLVSHAKNVNRIKGGAVAIN